MAAPADPPEHLAEILREILSLAGNKTASLTSEFRAGEAEHELEERERQRKSEEGHAILPLSEPPSH
jgi:hypothetical protein